MYPEIISERIGLIYFQQNKLLLENISEMELCLFLLLIKHFSLKLLRKNLELVLSKLYIYFNIKI